ncbi:CPBP family intramembrane glutamic endopeptidase [Methanobrevibacter filiformis]|uniref:CAAX amino terminal protease self-immunity n=1 Tax=Methanobrevibacter filiformis TaxID=55758 RepID=A0A166FDN1_9EURY|nr:CPBP family intramembrane glutamic endopeptidase [Methanobrevibacter filiformis]KZX17568.1 CAAX amino terminal protease self- immunity [Methanobrevibacter filiformis]
MNVENTSKKPGPLKPIIFVILIYIIGQIVAAMIISTVFNPIIGNNHDLMSVVGSVLLGLSTFILTIYVSFRVFKFKTNEIGLNKYKLGSRLLIGFVLAFICQLIMFIISLALGTAQIQAVGLNIFALIIALVVSMSAGISEEILDRGFFVAALKPTKNLLLILLAPTLFFTIAHIINMVSIGLDLTLSILALTTTFLAGIFLILIVIRTGSLAIAIAWHAGWDFFTTIFGGNLSSLNTGSPLFVVTHIGPDILTGGAYGIEASIIALIVLVILITLFYKFYPKSIHTTENKLMSLEFE